jgi:L-alanine-DL-glutamate epimerase-like enolase superfamily enzyme
VSVQVLPRASVDVRPHELVRSFEVSHGTTATVTAVALRLCAGDGADGLGEIAADATHGQDGAAIAARAGELATALAGDKDTTDPLHLEARLHEAVATVPAEALTLVEMAFLDRAARLRGVPVWRLLGLPAPGTVQLLTTVPIGEVLPESGPLKVKLGDPDDLTVLEQLAGLAGPVVLDVNRGWDRDAWQAVRARVAHVAPAVLEDPVNDVALLPEVRRALPGTAVILDEGMTDQAEVERATEVADGANVKVMRLGGLFPALRALQHLTRCGATRMLGCFLEPPRAIAYAAQLAAMADWADLDGHFWYSPAHPVVPGFTLDSREPGIPRIAEA